MKDKELRKIVYNTAKEFDEKLNYIYSKLRDIEQGDPVYLGGKYDPFIRLPPTGGFADGSIPDDRLSWKHIRKTKCKIDY